MSTSNLQRDLASLRIDRTRRGGASRAVKFLLFLVVLLLLGAGTALGYVLLQDRLNPPPQVKTDTVRVMTSSQLATVLTATGYLESRFQASVGARGAGRISELLVEEGKRVAKGELLAVPEHEDLKAMLASRVALVKQAESELAESIHNRDQRRRDFEREQQLRQRNAGTKSALETAETNFRASEVRVLALTAAVEVARARVLEAEVAINDMKIFAPFDGTILTKDADPGETIMPGGMGAASGRGSVCTMADLSKLEVDTDVKEDYLNRLHRGQPAEVLVDAVESHRYKGVLREIIPLGDRSRGVVKVKVTILDADERLFPDLSATVNFLPDADAASAGESTKSLYVPQSAIVEVGGETSLWRVVDGRVTRTAVTTKGQPKEGMVSIEGPISGGETIVVEPPATLVEGGSVRLPE